MKHILSHNVCDKSYLDRILSHWNTNTTTMILILTTRINCLTRLEKFGGNSPSSLKKTPPSENPSYLSAGFVSYVQFNFFSYLTFTKQG